MKTMRFRLSLLVITALQIFLIQPMAAQSLERQVVSSSGTTLVQGGYSLDFTIGEMITSTWTNDDVVSQGFHQVWAVITAVDDPSAAKFNVSVFPNPTAGILNIISDEAARISMFDLSGNKVFEGQKQAGPAQINLGDLQPGMFFLQFLTDKGSCATYKLEVIK